MLRRLLACSKVAIPLLIGICIGVALSFVILPLLEQSCEWTPRQIRSSQVLETDLTKRTSKHLRETVNWDSFRAKEYEPHIIQTPQSGDQTAKRPIRHRFIRSEIDMKETLFVGYLVEDMNTRGFALNQAVGRPQDNENAMKLFFNTHVNDQNNRGKQLQSFVSLNLLETNTLPLLAVKYIATNMQNYNTYKYYALFPDTTYLLTPTLVSYLQSTEDEQFIGFPSEDDETTCDISAGFIISKEVVAEVAGNIKSCEQVFKVTQNSMQAMNDCLQLITSITCVTLSAHMPKPLIQRKLNNKQTVSDIITSGCHIISGVQTSEQIYSIRRYIAQAELQSISDKIEKLEHGLDQLSVEADVKFSWPPAVNKPYETANRFDTLRWTLLLENRSYLEFDHINSQQLTGDYQQLHNDITKDVMARLNKHSHKYTLNKVLQSYRRLDPTRGIEYSITVDVHDLQLKEDQVKVFDIVRPATNFEMLPEASYDNEKHIHIIVPLFSQNSSFALLQNFNDLFKKDPFITLHLLLIYSTKEYENWQAGKADAFHDAKVAITNEEKTSANGRMLRWETIQDSGILQAKTITDVVRDIEGNSIVLTSTSETRITLQFLERIRAYVVEGKQLYAPIAFWQYDPKLIALTKGSSSNLEIARANGHFADKWFDHLAFTPTDLKRAKQYASKGFTNLYEVLSSLPEITVLRSPDADCLVIYHDHSCSQQNLADKLICTDHKLNNVGSGPILAMSLLKDKRH
ncbi:chondroitin sulfate synthase 2-like [Watersipora subatra]|uniref:chondroitin sulfate synthase 2-like n=1 Tax=Watersipora subatra TaxID=2589382 RepID=UPI00355BCB07